MLLKLRNVIVFLPFLFGCDNTHPIGEYEAFFYETYFKLTLSGNQHFELQIEGHFEDNTYEGKFKMDKDQLTLQNEELDWDMKEFKFLNDTCLINVDSGFDYCKYRSFPWGSKKHVFPE